MRPVRCLFGRHKWSSRVRFPGAYYVFDADDLCGRCGKHRYASNAPLP